VLPRELRAEEKTKPKAEDLRKLPRDDLERILASERLNPEEAARILNERKDARKKPAPEVGGGKKERAGAGSETGTGTVSPPAKPQEASRVPVFGAKLFEGSSTEFAPMIDIAPGPDYVLGPADELIVTVWGGVEFNWDVTVNREGKIVLPEIGVVSVVGLTIADVQKKLRKELGRVYKDFTLDVSLGKLRTIPVFVVGDVKRPGAYRVSAMATAFNALYRSGGPTRNGSLRRVKVIRNNKVISEIDFYEYLLKGDKSHDVRLEAGDTIFVPPVGKTSSVVGEVRRPARYELVGGEGVIDLIELAGGLTPGSYLSRVQIDRIESNERRIVRDIDLSTAFQDSASRVLSDIELMDGDVVTVFKVLEERRNVVRLVGNVERPGLYELRPAMRVRDLILEAEGIRGETYLARAEIVRLRSFKTREVIAFDLGSALDGNPEDNLSLQNQDIVVVYARSDVRPKDMVAIMGRVRKPGEYELTPNMQVGDLIFRAGGLDESAYLLEGYVSRVMAPLGADADSISILIPFDVGEAVLHDDSPDNIALRPNDKVIIRATPGWQLQEVVQVTGEVKFPGPYPLTRKGERLSDLIREAGGVTKEAFLRGASFFRPREGRVIVDMAKALSNPGGVEDIVLADGDSINVPRVPSTVRVAGAVMREGSLAYVPGKGFRYYLERTGGFIDESDPDNIRIVRVDGVVEKAERRFWFDRPVKAGNTIIVGAKKQQKEIDWSETIKDATSIVASVATTVYLVTRLR